MWKTKTDIYKKKSRKRNGHGFKNDLWFFVNRKLFGSGIKWTSTVKIGRLLFFHFRQDLVVLNVQESAKLACSNPVIDEDTPGWYKTLSLKFHGDKQVLSFKENRSDMQLKTKLKTFT